MKLRLLPSSFEKDGSASPRQHLTCFILNDTIAIDAGSLAMALDDKVRELVKDVVLTHAHLDHIAGLPLFLDDQFSTISEPLRIHASSEVIEILERDVFNWSIYPRFSELRNQFGPVVEYRTFDAASILRIGSVEITPVAVNHKVPCSGFVISENGHSIAITGDTAEMESYWETVNRRNDLSALLIECAFPDELSDLAENSHHLTPSALAGELTKFRLSNCPVFVINIKPAYRERVIDQISRSGLDQVSILEIGREYVF